MEKLKAYLICSVSLMCLFLFGGLLYTAFGEAPAVSTSAEGNNTVRDRIIVIDPGHGGEDGGASDNGLLEKDINLSIALKLRDMLRSCGIRTVMTRESDISVYDSSAGTTREKKISDLKNRLAIVNSDPDNILISIHQNKFEQSKYSGTQMFYSTNVPESEKIAEALRKSVTGLLQPDNKRELKPDTTGVYLLKNAEVPAVIVECGFLSNPGEAKLLGDPEYQQKMAFALFCALCS